MTYERNTGDGLSRIAGVTDLESAIKVCEQYKLPLFNADVDSVKRGSIAAMGFDYYKHGYQTGAMAQRILQGADPMLWWASVGRWWPKTRELRMSTWASAPSLPAWHR